MFTSVTPTYADHKPEEAGNRALNQLQKTSQNDYNQLKISIDISETYEENHFNFQIYSLFFYNAVLAPKFEKRLVLNKLFQGHDLSQTSNYRAM